MSDIITKSKAKDDLIDLSSPEISHDLLHYSELIASNLETKPMTEKMDHWYLDLRKNLMNEFDKLRLQFLEEAQQNILHEKQVQIKDYTRLNRDVKIMREMLNHYESIINEKYQTEKNLNKALDLLYNKTIVYHRYYEWRVDFIEKKREKYALILAKHFYEEKIKRKALRNWKNMIEYQWKKHFELICDKKSKVILNEYKLKSKQLELELLNANEEINRLRMNKNEHDESLKKTFMRGICALNMEAMTVLLKDEKDLNRINEEKQRQYYKNKDNDNSNESTTNSEEQYRLKCHHRTYPAHVSKMTCHTGERSSNNHHHHHVVFHKHQSTSTNKQ